MFRPTLAPSFQDLTRPDADATLDNAAKPIIQDLLDMLKAAVRAGQCDSLETIRQSLTSAAWSDIKLSSGQLYHAACEGQQATAYLWLASYGLKVICPREEEPIRSLHFASNLQHASAY